MKFIFSFFLYIVSLSPVLATVTENCTTSSSPSGCSIGCYIDEFATPAACVQCQSGYYNTGAFTDGCHACDDGFDTGWADLNMQHPAGASSCADWECISGYNLVNIAGIETCQLCDPAILPANAEFVNGNDASCAWQCEEGFYKNSTGTGCNECPDGSISAPGADSISQCTCQSKSNGNNAMSLLLIQITGNQYYCGWCGDGTASNTNPVQCTCYHGANIVNGEQTVAQNTPIQCKCPSNTDTVDTTTNTCQCGADHYLKSNNGTWTCEQCPAHSHHNITGSEDVNDCVCDEDHPKEIYDDNNKLIECGQCPDSNSTYDSVANKCKCIKGYYNTSTDTNTVSCTACPAGSTTTGIGATARSACTMNSSTQFCDSRGQNCMNLIPNGVEISASAN